MPERDPVDPPAVLTTAPQVETDKTAEFDPDFARSMLIQLEEKKVEIVSAIGALLAGESIIDDTDRRLIAEALAFIEVPTKMLADIEKHTTNVVAVLGGYSMQGEDPPAALDAMNGYLTALQLIAQINSAKAMIQNGRFDAKDLAKTIKRAEDSAHTLSSQRIPYGYDISEPMRALRLLTTTVL